MTTTGNETWYDVLGVSSTATQDEIRDAHRDQVARFHPDLHSDNPLQGLAADRLLKVNQAWEVLSDPERRAKYDTEAEIASHAGWGGRSRSRFGRGSHAPPGPYRLLERIAWGIVILVGAFVCMRVSRVLRGTPFGGVALVTVVAGAWIWWIRRRRRRG